MRWVYWGRKSRSSATSACGAWVGMKCPAFSISSNRAPGILLASSAEADLRQHVQHVGARQSAKGKTEAYRIVGEIASEIGFVGAALAEIWRIGQGKRRRQRRTHAFACGGCRALVEHGGAACIDARRRIAESERADVVGIFFQITQRLRGGGGNGDEVIGRRQVQAGSERLKILDEHIIGEFLPYLFRQSCATLVIAQHAKAFGKPRRHGVPGMQGAAELMQQHDGTAATAGEFVVKAHAISVQKSFRERQRISPQKPSPQRPSMRSSE